MPARRFFSGRTLQQALLDAARHHGVEPESVAYRVRDRAGAVKARNKVVIEVDPEAPDCRGEGEDELLDVVRTVLDVAGVDVRAAVVAGGEAEMLRVDLDGPDRELLWEDEARGLRAVETLVSLSARARLEGRSWVLDLAGRRRAAHEVLETQARAVARRVASTGEEEDLEPMVPAERRVVHMALEGFSGVETRSVGREDARRVRVVPSDPDASGESDGHD